MAREEIITLRGSTLGLDHSTTEANEKENRTNKQSGERADVYTRITEQILNLLERGVVPWRKPWTTGAPRNLASENAYRGINAFYDPKLDVVHMPRRQYFVGGEEFDSTLGHELIHATGHLYQLNREEVTRGYHSNRYNREEPETRVNQAIVNR